MRGLSREEERARMAEALRLTREAMSLSDSYAPTAHTCLALAATVFQAMTDDRSGR